MPPRCDIHSCIHCVYSTRDIRRSSITCTRWHSVHSSLNVPPVVDNLYVPAQCAFAPQCPLIVNKPLVYIRCAFTPQCPPAVDKPPLHIRCASPGFIAQKNEADISARLTLPQPYSLCNRSNHSKPSIASANTFPMLSEITRSA